MRSALPLAAAVAVSALALTPVAHARTFRFTYAAEIGPVEGPGPVHVFIPVAQDDPQQRILSFSADTSVPGAMELERGHGNRFWHGVVADPKGETVRATFTYVVERDAFESDALGKRLPRDLSKQEREDQARWLGPDAHVPVGDPVLQPIVAEVERAAGSRNKAAIARATYDWLVDHLEYKKEGTGWGQGDVYWACSQRYGNCTDFHSLFNAVSRTEGIPSRFEIGFPVPADKPAGTIGGYHCWTWFMLPSAGWLPLDASEAAKNKARREELYGKLPADRIHFTTGRDLQLGPDQKSGPVNFFVYPLVEQGGERWTGSVKTTFSYEDVR